MLCIHCYVSGRVQGVWYRASTQEKARDCGLTGWVRNCPDGRVELKACGPADQIELFKQWLWQGPPAAQVTAVDVELIAEETFNGFSVTAR